jgi:hypothetical protein
MKGNIIKTEVETTEAMDDVDEGDMVEDVDGDGDGDDDDEQENETDEMMITINTEGEQPELIINDHSENQS